MRSVYGDVANLSRVHKRITPERPVEERQLAGLIMWVPMGLVQEGLSGLSCGWLGPVMDGDDRFVKLAIVM